MFLLVGLTACSNDASNALDMAESDMATATPITPGAITCGTQSCTLATSPGCCDTNSGTSCTNAACPTTTYKCDGPEDCGGNACCGDVGSACSTTKTCPAG